MLSQVWQFFCGGCCVGVGGGGGVVSRSRLIVLSVLIWVQTVCKEFFENTNFEKKSAVDNKSIKITRHAKS